MIAGDAFLTLSAREARPWATARNMQLPSGLVGTTPPLCGAYSCNLHLNCTSSSFSHSLQIRVSETEERWCLRLADPIGPNLSTRFHRGHGSCRRGRAESGLVQQRKLHNTRWSVRLVVHACTLNDVCMCVHEYVCVCLYVYIYIYICISVFRRLTQTMRRRRILMLNERCWQELFGCALSWFPAPDALCSGFAQTVPSRGFQSLMVFQHVSYCCFLETYRLPLVFWYGRSALQMLSIWELCW